MWTATTINLSFKVNVKIDNDEPTAYYCYLRVSPQVPS